MTLSAIVAVADNGVIGLEGGLPWRLPRDLRWFKEKTLGHALIMGRRTFESLKGVLPGRRAIVLTRDETFTAPGATVVHTLEDALRAAETDEAGRADEEPFIAGGAEIYHAAMPKIERVYLTRIHARPKGDTTLDLDLTGWRKVFSERFEADDRNEHAMTFEIYTR